MDPSSLNISSASGGFVDPPPLDPLLLALVASSMSVGGPMVPAQRRLPVAQQQNGGGRAGSPSKEQLHAMVKNLTDCLAYTNGKLDALEKAPEDSYERYVGYLVYLQRAKDLGDKTMVHEFSNRLSEYEGKGWISVDWPQGQKYKAQQQAEDILNKERPNIMRCFESDDAKFALSMSSGGPRERDSKAAFVDLLRTAIHADRRREGIDARIKMDRIANGISGAIAKADELIAVHDSKIAKEQESITAYNTVKKSMHQLSEMVALAQFMETSPQTLEKSGPSLPQSLWSQLDLWYQGFVCCRNDIRLWQPDFLAGFLGIDFDLVETLDLSTCIMLLAFLSSINYTQGLYIFAKLETYKDAGLLWRDFDLRNVYANSAFTVEIQRMLLIIYLDLVPEDWTEGGFRIIRRLACNTTYCPWMYCFEQPLSERVANLEAIVWPVPTSASMAMISSQRAEAGRTKQSLKLGMVEEIVKEDWGRFVRQFPMKTRRSYEFDAFKEARLGEIASPNLCNKYGGCKNNVNEIESVYAFLLTECYVKSLDCQEP